MALEATTRTAGGLRTDLGTWPPLASRMVRCRRPGRRLLGLGGGQPQQQSCGTRATEEADVQQLQAPRRAHVMVVSVGR